MGVAVRHWSLIVLNNVHVVFSMAIVYSTCMFRLLIIESNQCGKRKLMYIYTCSSLGNNLRTQTPKEFW